MKYFLVVDELKYKAGVYGTYHSKEEIIKFYENQPQEDESVWPVIMVLTIGLPFMILYGLFSGVKYMFSNSNIIRMLIPENSNNRTLPPHQTSNSSEIKYSGYIAVTSDLLQSYSDYNNKIFHNAFNSSKQLETLLPKNSGNELIILSYESAKKHIKNGSIEHGLNVANSDFTELYPLSGYTSNKWSMITANLFNCFRNLGAKEISMTDAHETKNSVDIKVKTPDVDLKQGVEVNSSNGFSFSRKMEESVYNPKKAKVYLSAFQNDLPLTYANALDMITNKPTGDS